MSKTTLISAAATVLLALPLLVGCGLGGPTPEEVTQAFIDASAANDRAAMQPLVTTKAWEFFASQPENSGFEPPEVPDAQLGKAAIEGENASVPYSNSEGTAKYLLRKEEGAWKIYA